MAKNTLDGIALMFLRMVPDSILIPRIEAQMARKEEAANRALEQLAMYVKRSERELGELRPAFEIKEAEIQNLISKGLTDAAAEMMEEFDALEAEYKAKVQEFESGKADFEVSYAEAQMAIQDMQKQLKAIKSDSARAQATEHLNELRKSVSGTRFEAGGLVDDLNLIKDRNRDRIDRSAGTKMMLDKQTGRTREKVETNKAVQKANNEARLSRFAAQRNISVPNSTPATPAASEGPAPIMQDSEKEKA